MGRHLWSEERIIDNAALQPPRDGGKHHSVKIREDPCPNQIQFNEVSNRIGALNDLKFGYLIQGTSDLANVKKIDQNTGQLYYHYRTIGGGR